ncbi:hypothetical protein [Fibrivirga algicola]|uniref:Uncharacterized protein n=1 Tax=Fibrivirga algicola TaxID=2950420 RepID=A0ABX0QHI2_9BACT|nr:hypothetical protein [Fibrivirga algicola]ARK10645.1 hypothetical protein A6C57_10065 [Fibrella sp. ES10-3-2-2]NID10143.1 hypothetical protein [Fibrivirga algicola]
MKKQWIASIALAVCLATTGFAQTQSRTPTNGNATPSTQRNTSSREGLDRKGGTDVGTRGSEKMKDGVSRSGNSNLSPTSPSNPPPAGGDKPGSSGATGGGTTTSAGTMAPEAGTASARTKPKGTGTRNGNTGSAGTKPVQTQGSTSEGTASAPSAGGAPGTGVKTVRSVQPKSRAAVLEQDAKQNQASAAGQAGSASKTGTNGQTSPGARNVSVTERGQKEGSYSDAAKRNKTAEGPSKDPLKTGPNGQQTKPKQ